MCANAHYFFLSICIITLLNEPSQIVWLIYAKQFIIMHENKKQKQFFVEFVELI